MTAESPARKRNPVSAVALALLALSALCSPRLLIRAQAPPAEERGRVEARIKSLEEAVAKQRARLGAAEQAGKETPAGEGSPEVFSTAAWAKAGSVPGVTPKETIDNLLGFVVRSDGAGLVREMEKLISEGDKGHAVLQDFLHALDKNAELGKKLAGRYDLAFALTHLAMRQEEGMARMAHSYLGATGETTRTVLRGYLHNFLPVFLRFHAGRFPDLEQDLRDEILRLLLAGDKRLRLLFEAGEALGYFPPVEIAKRRLAAATDFQEHSALIFHLGARNDKESVRILRGFVVKNMRIYGGAVSQALITLARMSDPEVERVFRELTWTKDAFIYAKAIRAYFAISRHDGFTPEARRYLNSRVSFSDKKLFINQLRRVNPGILEELRATLGQLSSQEVRDFVLK